MGARSGSRGGTGGADGLGGDSGRPAAAGAAAAGAAGADPAPVSGQPVTAQHERLAPNAAAAAAALQAITAGAWDGHLARLSAAIRDRMRTEAWRHAIGAGVKS